MGRSFLTQPFSRSNKRAWALVALVAGIGALVGTSARGLVSGTRSIRTADPLATAQSSQTGLRVLFIGNSFTYFNAMPSMVATLAATTRGAHQRIIAVQYAPGGSHLAQAANDPALLKLLARVRWNVVVLQEQSQVPALPYWLVHQSLPAVQVLTKLIRHDGAVPVLFETWGYRMGDRDNYPADSYAAMQGRLDRGYAYLARKAHIAIVPVGDIWDLALTHHPGLPLWSLDGRHPSLEGSYLTASAFADALSALPPGAGSRGGPARSTYSAGLNPATAASLRQIAAEGIHQEFPAAR